MSIRRRNIANRLLYWLETKPDDSEEVRLTTQVMKSSSRLSRYIAYHLKRLEND